jgi:MFS transporter, Spinster family, sphingosine-1-phosphate transporter
MAVDDVTLTTATATDEPQPGAGVAALRYARYVFWLMFAINFANYADRWVFAALSNQLKTSFRFDDFQVGVLSSAFLLVYTLVAFPTGYIADRLSRTKIVAAGVALWSLATVLTAVAGNFLVMLIVRSLVGVGEGSYYPAGTALLSAYTPPRQRATRLARWSVGALVGAGVGFLLAAALANHNWRLAFYLTGVPGLGLAALIWRVREKARHEDDPPDEGGASQEPATRAIRRYLRIRTLRVVLATHALGFFALTAVSTFLVIYLGTTYGSAPTVDGSHTYAAPYPSAGLGAGLVALIPGVVLLIGGISGTFAGGALANRLSRTRPGGRVLAGGLGFLLAAPTVALTLLTPRFLRAIPDYVAATPGTQVALGVAFFVLLGTLAAFLLNLYNGPSTAALQDVVPSRDRAAAGGLELTLAHLLGDIYAPAAVGALAVVLSRRFGGDQIGTALLLTCPVVLLAAGLVAIWGSQFYEYDVAALGATAAEMAGR